MPIPYFVSATTRATPSFNKTGFVYPGCIYLNGFNPSADVPWNAVPVLTSKQTTPIIRLLGDGVGNSIIALTDSGTSIFYAPGVYDSAAGSTAIEISGFTLQFAAGVSAATAISIAGAGSTSATDITNVFIDSLLITQSSVNGTGNTGISLAYSQGNFLSRLNIELCQTGIALFDCGDSALSDILIAQGSGPGISINGRAWDASDHLNEGIYLTNVQTNAQAQGLLIRDQAWGATSGCSFTSAPLGGLVATGSQPGALVQGWSFSGTQFMGAPPITAVATQNSVTVNNAGAAGIATKLYVPVAGILPGQLAYGPNMTPGGMVASVNPADPSVTLDRIVTAGATVVPSGSTCVFVTPNSAQLAGQVALAADVATGATILSIPPTWWLSPGMGVAGTSISSGTTILSAVPVVISGTVSSTSVAISNGTGGTISQQSVISFLRPSPGSNTVLQGPTVASVGTTITNTLTLSHNLGILPGMVAVGNSLLSGSTVNSVVQNGTTTTTVALTYPTTALPVIGDPYLFFQPGQAATGTAKTASAAAMSTSTLAFAATPWLVAGMAIQGPGIQPGTTAAGVVQAPGTTTVTTSSTLTAGVTAGTAMQFVLPSFGPTNGTMVSDGSIASGSTLTLASPASAGWIRPGMSVLGGNIPTGAVVASVAIGATSATVVLSGAISGSVPTGSVIGFVQPNSLALPAASPSAPGSALVSFGTAATAPLLQPGMNVYDLANNSVAANTVISRVDGNGASVTLGTPVLAAGASAGVVAGDTISFAIIRAIPNAIPPGSYVLNFGTTSLSGVTAGMSVTNLSDPGSIPAGTTVLLVSGQFIFLAATATATVSSGDFITFGGDTAIATTSATSAGGSALNFSAGALSHVATNQSIQNQTHPASIPIGAIVQTVSGGVVTMMSSLIGGGIRAGDLIQFGSAVTVATTGATAVGGNVLHFGGNSLASVTTAMTAMDLTRPAIPQGTVVTTVTNTGADHTVTLGGTVGANGIATSDSLLLASSHGVQLDHATLSFQFTGCFIADSPGFGLVANGAAFISIAGSNLQANAAGAVYLNAATGVTATGNAVAANGYGFRVAGGGYHAINGNSILFNQYAGIFVTAGAQQVAFASNALSNNAGGGMQIEASQLLNINSSNMGLNSAFDIVLQGVTSCLVQGINAATRPADNSAPIREAGLSNYNLYVGNIIAGTALGLTGYNSSTTSFNMIRP